MASQLTMAQLAQTLKQQATPAPHFITLDDATLQRTGVDQTISDFLLRKNVLVVVDPATIPDNPPPSGFTLQGSLPTDTDDTFFNLTGRDCSVQFVQNGSVIDFQLAINPESEGGEWVKWFFSDSFGAQTVIFNNLPIEDPRLLFTTYDISQSVVTGLNFSSSMPLIGVLADVPALIGGSTSSALLAAGSDAPIPAANSSTYTLQGLISQVEQGATFDLQASLNTPTVDITFIKITSPFVGTMLTYEEVDDGGGGTSLVSYTEVAEKKWTAVSQIYVGAGIEISNSSGTEVPLEIRAILPLRSGIPLMLFRVGPPPGFITSINDLGSLLAGNTWNEFFEGPAAVLQPYVATFGLMSFTVKVNLSKLTVISLNLEAGISEPWKFFNDMFVMNKFDVTWVIISPTGNTLQNAEISSVITLFDNPAFTFAVDMLLPDLFISGQYAGTVAFTMADIVEEVNSFFGFSLPVPPDDMATFSFGNFTTTIDIPGNIFTFSAIASISLNLFGLELLGLQDTYFFVTVNKAAGAKVPVSISITGTLVVMGLQFYVNASYGETIEFEIHMVNTTVGDLLNWLVHLVDPTFDISFPTPWNKLLDISLDALVLKISDSDTKKSVSLTYETTIDLGFMTITGLGLTYTKTGTAPGAVEVALSGTFLGQTFGTGSSNPPLGWNAMNGTPPAVPGAGSSLFDLEYIGLGQHIAFNGIEFTNIQDVMKALRASVVPSQTGQLPPFGSNGLSFSSQSNWLIGAQFSVMGTVAISAIFNDPNLYGILIALSGEKAKIFAGLSFQILYRKVNDSIGVYHIELKLPDAMRNLQFGSVSITLPVVILDIYTNGNFRVDFGFPKGLDFSNSFSIQIFPFVGYGGFYFALLDGATSSRVPQITNGSFSPVIEFGIALSLGVGKTVSAGILSGGITVTVIGILQGVLGWFNPTDNSPKETYYWIQGTVAIVGRLYATIDFAIIQASVDVTAYASVTLTIESHQPIYIAINAGVSVRVSVKIVFFTIHLSFKATVSASFTIGSASATPWKLASSGSNGKSALMAASTAPQLRGQGTLYSTAHRHAGYALAMRQSLLAAPPVITTWPAVTVLSGGAQTVTIWAMPAFTKSESVADGADAIMLLAAQNSVDPGAATHAQHRVLYGADPASQTFNLLMQAMLGWGIYVETTRSIASGGAVRAGGITTITTSTPHGLDLGGGVIIAGVTDASFNGTFPVASVPSATTFTYKQDGKPDGTSGGGTAGSASVSAAQLLDLQWQLEQSDMVAAAFDYPTLTAFLAKNFTFDVTPVADVSTETGVAIFPMIPAVKLTDTTGISVPFGSFNSVDDDYQKKVAAYFQLLQVQYQSRNSGGDSSSLKAELGGALDSMATVIFSRYFNMLMSSGVKAAIDFLASYPYLTGSSAMSIDDIAVAVGDDLLLSYPMHVVSPNQDLDVLNPGAVIVLPEVVYQIRTNETFAGIASAFQKQGALNGSGAPYAVADLMEANIDTSGIFNIGTGVAFSGIGYVTQAYDTLDLIATRIMVRAAGSPLLTTVVNLTAMVQTLLGLNPAITDPNVPIVGISTVVLPDDGSYSVVSGDTLTLIAAYILVFEQGLVDTVTYVSQILELNSGLPVTDPLAEQPLNTSIAMPPVARAIASVDTIATLAVTLITTVAIVETNILAIPTDTVLLAPQGVLKVPLEYAIAAGDTFSGIGAKFDLAMDYLAAQAVGTIPSSGPKVFAASKALTILDLASIAIDALMDGLLTQSEWNNTSGMVSRFLLSGLRLPDPNNAYFKSLTVADLSDPTKLGPIVTAPMFGLTGQQYPITAPAPDGYAITLANDAGVSWLNFNGQSSVTFTLTADQQTMLTEIATTPLQPDIETLTRLSLFQMVPPRIALQEHITWQAAVPPSGCLAGGAVTGNPSVWLFPDPLVLQIEDSSSAGSGLPLLYEVVVSKHTDPNRPVTAEQAGCYAWGTIVDFTVSLPSTADPSVVNAYVIGGADDVGAELLQKIYAYLTSGSDEASLYLLYSPNPSGTNPTGLISDQLNADSTYILKTNLSTLTHSGNQVMLAEREVASDPTKVFSATLNDPADFIALLWQASITRSGGFYMNYVNQNGSAALPPSVFGTETTATLSLLVLLDSQAANRDAQVQPFNNCAVVGDNIDTTVSSLFVQPATYLVAEGDSLTSAAASFNAAWGTAFTMLDGATFNQSIPLLLEVGATLTIPGQGSPYEIVYGDTLASIVAQFKLASLNALVTAGSNATAPILAAGTEMQFANKSLQPATMVPPGTIGFEITRTNPDPDNLPYNQLQAAQIVGNLFNLVGFNIAAVNGFTKSGAGLPTTPSDSLQEGTDGLEEREVDDTTNANWYYSQTIAVGPFGNPQHGSASAALPGVEWNPYNGVVNGATLNHAQIDLDMQDIYGNIQNLPPEYSSLTVPVGYYDDIVTLASWPSLAASYEIAGSPVAVSIAMTMQQSRYIPSPSVPVSSALAAIAADLTSYTTIYYQLAQPDLSFALQTTLALDPSSGNPVNYPLSKTPFFAFAYGAYTYLAALATMQGVQLTMSGNSTSVLDVTTQYGCTPQQLFATNQESLYESLFGPALLNIPLMYTTVQDDTLSSIVAKQSAPVPTVNELAEWNSGTALYEGIDLVAPQERTITAGSSDELNGVAKRAQASVTSLAQANATETTILTEGITLSVGALSYQLGKDDSFANAALHLDATVADVATANQWIPGLFVDGATLKVNDILVAGDDTFFSLAATYTAGDIDSLATANSAVQNLFAPGTAVRVGWKTDAIAPELSDTLTTFSTANGITVDQLAAANNTADAHFIDGAKVDIPGVMVNTSTSQYCTYTAESSDTVDDIAKKFGVTAADITALNTGIPGLLVGGPGSAVIAGSLWICPPMRGDANGLNPGLTLQGLATAYNTDTKTLGTANAAAIGFLASGVEVTIGSVTITTNGSTTLNAFVNAVAPEGLSLDDVITAIASTPKLISASASVVPIPPPSPLGNGAVITPHFNETVFQITMNTVTTRVTDYIDPDFKTVKSVSTSIYGVPPEPDQEVSGDTYTFTRFATDLQGAIPGLYVATGDTVTEGDSPNASTFWGANFGSGAGPAITYKFNGGENTQYFAIPPLSTALMGGTVDIQPYVSGQGLTGPTQSQTFQAVDLDVWLNTFLGATDLFLSPSYAIPAYAIAPIDTMQVVQQKGLLAQGISERLQYVLQVTQGGSMADAKAAIYQALLTELSSAFTIDTLVQVPVTVDSPYTDPLAAPRLSGKIAMADTGVADVQAPSTLPSAFSFSTAKVALTKPASTGTFLFSVKSPADHREANLNLQYDITELEIPDPSSIIGDYEGSSWLKFILPIETQSSAIGEIDIPIPLRSYPSPVTLLSQSAMQSVAEPSQATDLLEWDFGFIYQHDDAEQDTPLVAITFNAAGGPVLQAALGSTVNLNAIFAALAQFMAVYPALKEDLALLPGIVPGTQSPAALAAVNTFRTLVDDLVTAWYKTLFSAAFNPPPITYYYQMQKDQALDGTLTTLTISSVDPNTGGAVKNPTVLWPDVYITDQKTKLELATSDDLHAVYNYPPGISASTPLIQEFVYAWSQTETANSAPSSPAVMPDGLDATAPQTFTFKDVNILSQQNGRAGVSITRNLVLVRDRATGAAINTNPAFIYQTPLTKFTSNAIPSNFAGNDIVIGNPPTGIAQALGTFLNGLLNTDNTWSAGDTIGIRFSAAYSYALTTSDGSGSNGPSQLAALVPIMLVPSYDFNPATDWKWDPADNGSFVNQVQAVIDAWQSSYSPSTTNGAFQFDLIVYASQGQLQPLVQATSLQYLLAAPGGA